MQEIHLKIKNVLPKYLGKQAYWIEEKYISRLTIPNMKYKIGDYVNVYLRHLTNDDRLNKFLIIGINFNFHGNTLGYSILVEDQKIDSWKIRENELITHSIPPIYLNKQAWFIVENSILGLAKINNCSQCLQQKLDLEIKFNWHLIK